MFVQHILRTSVQELLGTLPPGDKSRVAAQTTRGRQTAAGIKGQVNKYAEVKLVMFPAATEFIRRFGRRSIRRLMMVRISKTMVAGISALAMTTAAVLPTTPASAGGWRVGGGGWHGGGWGGGWHGGWGGWHGGGWAGRGVWHPGYWRGGYWYNGWWGPAVAAGVLAGAAIATVPYWGGGYYGGGCWQYRPVYDGYGNYLGQQSVNVC
jgi:hypothetical protein